MSLSSRLSTFFLAALGLVLMGFSSALYASAGVYLHRQLGDRLDASLAILAAAAEIHPEGVEWEPQERELPLGQDIGPDRLRWMVHDGWARLVDHSRNLAAANLTTRWTPGSDGRLPDRLVDRQGRPWRLAQRRLLPGTSPAPSGSSVASRPGAVPDSDPPGVLYPTLMLTVGTPVEPTETALSNLAWTLGGMSLGVWGVAAVLGRRLCQRALAPLRQMVDSARGLDAAEPGWCLPEVGTGDEIEDLSRTFNELLARLHVAYQRQRRFGGDASHQLRTPLTALLGQIEVALRHDRPPAEYRRVLRLAHDQAAHLRQILEALLFLGRAEADAGVPAGETLDLVRWVAEHLAGRPGHPRTPDIVREEGADGPLWVLVHPPLLGQLLDNLLDNACKYSASGTRIAVRTYRGAEGPALAVEDAGMGIALEDMPRVFEPFYRSAQTRSLGRPGVGLGLTVARRIAVASGGTIVVRSELGKGSRFELRLPATTPRGRPDEAGTLDGPHMTRARSD